MRRRTVLILALTLWPAIALAAPAPELAVGQLWSIRAASPTAAKVVIGAFDTLPDGRAVVSISLIDVPTARGPVVIGHLAFDQAVLTASLDALLATGQAPPPQFAAGYRQWRDDPEGGVFTIPVDDALAGFQDQLRTVGR